MWAQVGRRGIAAAFAYGLVALVAASSAAGQSTVPRGNSEVDQYAGALTEDTGGRPIGSIPAGGAGEPSAALGTGVAQELKQLGPEGRATADLAEATAPRGDGVKDERMEGPSEGGAIGGALDGSEDGLGILLPAILVAIATAGVTFLLVRRRPA